MPRPLPSECQLCPVSPWAIMFPEMSLKQRALRGIGRRHWLRGRYYGAE
jgi:hypothetical protein